MGFQTLVRDRQAFGVPGEFYDTSPRRAASYVLDGDGVIARAFTHSAEEGKIVMGGTGPFAGILMSPKSYVRPGTDSSGTLAVASGTQVEAADKGRIIVTLGTAAQIGHFVVYDPATGELSAVADASTLGGKALVPGAKIALFTVEAGGLAVIEM